VALEFPDLDDRTRQFMLEELDRDIAEQSLYLSPHLTGPGRTEYERALRAAILDGGEETLADALRAPGHMEMAAGWKPKGGPLANGLPSTAPDTLAEAEFHRFYARGLCRRAIADGVYTLVIYRARPAAPARTNAEAMVGVRIDARSLLDDLRSAPGQTPPRMLPASPNSGLSVRLS